MTKETESKEQIETYWKKINNIENRIEELSRKGIDYSVESRKREVMLRKVKYLENKGK